MTQLHELIQQLERWAPPAYQESYDNAGLIVGDPAWPVQGVLCSLDCTEAVVDEAIRKGCNVVIAHHPIVFKGLKSLTGRTYVERTVLKAIRHDVALYAIHTNLDSVVGGVNWMIAARLGLQNVRVLAPKKQLLMKLTTFVPLPDTAAVLEALYAAGAGQIGEYAGCSFRTVGTGTFTPSAAANPTLGTHGKPEEVKEHRLEVLFPAYLQGRVLDALRGAHPYEEVAYYLHTLENENQEVGAGAVGELPEPLEATDFLRLLKQNMQTPLVKHTEPPGRLIRRVAVCGGVGSFLLSAAQRAQADVFVTADYKYHEFFDAEGRLMICDIGHYESEVHTKDILYTYLSEKFDNFALYLSEVNTNPVRYFM